MGIKGTVFIVLAIIGAAINFAARPISERTNISELTVKLSALGLVLVSVILLFIFGK